MDAQKSVSIFDTVKKLTNGRLCDFVVNTVNVPDTELNSILCCKDHGTVLFFSMSTSFTRVALGCEGVGKVLTLLVGTGYTEGHASITYQILRDCPGLREYFEDIYGA
jgi:L-erythro-3,5-diaminohexanoate dehydrogenase